MPELRELTQALEPIVGRWYLESHADATGRYAVDGMAPLVAASPADAAQAAAVLAAAARIGAAVVPWGAGTAMGRGHVPAAYDVALSLARLDQVVDFDVDNLTVTVQAGLSLGRLQAVLGPRRQFLPLEPPRADVATVGGIVAANSNGPGRMRYGSVRDLVLGMRMALTSGDVVHVGGKTVKNVAGYDLSKLFIGSCGTLGVITEVTLRTVPLPAERRALWLGFAAAADAHRLAARFLDSVLLPTYLAVLNRPAISRVQPGSPDEFALVIGLDGSLETVERQQRDIAAMAVAPRLCQGEELDRLERALRDFGSVADGRSGAEVAATASLPISAAEAFLAEAVSIAEGVGWVASVPSGTVRLLFEARETSAAVAGYERLVAVAERLDGHCVLDWAAPAVKARVPVWGSARPEWSLSRAMKLKFDLAGTLNRGRFVGGI